MSDLNNATQQKLEHLFDMRSGYVLDFTNASFDSFIYTSIKFDAAEYSGSKASRLRQLWSHQSNKNVAKVTLEMLERWRTNKLMGNENITHNEQTLYEECTVELKELLGQPEASRTDIQFLAKDFGKIDLAKINIPISFKDIIEQRIDEIEKGIASKSPLSVIFLCGSTLEGLLYEVASKNIQAFNQCKSAPQSQGKVKPLPDWSLDSLIITSRELGVIGEDVVKHAHAVKDFRNYIHPRQQAKESFTPRMFTAEMANKVLQAAIADLIAKKYQQP